MTRSSPPLRAATAHWMPWILPLAALAACTSSDPDELAVVESPLTAEHCSFFAEGDKVTICHRTASDKNPYVVIKTNYAGCAAGHVGHVGDYVSTSDPTCREKGCYPEGAPADDIVPCCGGEPIDGYCPPIDACKLTPCGRDELCEDLPAPAVGDETGRVCTPNPCANKVCEPKDKCHTSACDTKSGECTSTPLSGSACDDGDACTGDDVCSDGACAGKPIEGCGEPAQPVCSLVVPSGKNILGAKGTFAATFEMHLPTGEPLTFTGPLHLTIGFKQIGGNRDANSTFTFLPGEPLVDGGPVALAFDGDGHLTLPLARALTLMAPKGLDGVYVVSGYARANASDAAGKNLVLHCFTNEVSAQVLNNAPVLK